ncbi:MAG: hypothetical protein KC417_13405 [Myxococcales bacterium]|nr:hypothetical protein [Myxococcales bacterium]
MNAAQAPIRIAAWSGPRNISTAMMRAWENRPDTSVVDEPLYAHYLAVTGIDHPGRDATLASGERDLGRAVSFLLGPVPGGRAVFYQKHMTHHMLPGMDTDWFRSVRHAFLIRDPREVLLSYIKGRSEVTLEDLGVPQQQALYETVVALGDGEPLVIDAGEFLRNPEAHLRIWCEHLGLAFTERMLHWPAGPRDTDGAWAPHWYDAVLRSTGFEPWRERDRNTPPEHNDIVRAAMPIYEALHDKRVRV